jgi:hypothetical protein
MLNGYKNRLLAMKEDNEMKNYYESEIPKIERIIDTTTHYEIEAIYEVDAFGATNNLRSEAGKLLVDEDS